MTTVALFSLCTLGLALSGVRTGHLDHALHLIRGARGVALELTSPAVSRIVKFLRTISACLAGLFLIGMLGISTAHASSYEEALQSYETTLESRQQLVQELTELEKRHGRLVDRITAMKRDSTSGITTRLALEDLLSQSNDLSNELNRINDRLRRVEETLGARRQVVLKTIDKRIKTLERSLANADARQRRQTVASLNSLKAQRQAFAAPLPGRPTRNEVDATLTLAQQAESPDELLAAVDEIEDTEAQLQRRLKAIDSRLSDLKQSRRLLRRASDFATEERFFEEADRERVIARFTEGSDETPGVPSGDSDDVANESPQMESPSVDDGLNSGNNLNSPGDPGFAGAPNRDFADDDAVAAPPEQSPEPTQPDRGLFEPSRETITINTAEDPSRSVGSADSANRSSVDGQIRSLELERRRLERETKRLRDRASHLRKRATDLD